MYEWEIIYICENGYEGTEIVSAVNKMMAWDMFEDISRDYGSKVISADCHRITG